MLVSELTIRLQADGDRHRIVTNVIGELIRDGRLPVGRRLPAERELAKKLGLSRTTIVRAYASLETMSLLDRRVGSGSFVRPHRSPDQPRMLDLLDQLIDIEPARNQGLINLSVSTPSVLPELGNAIRDVTNDVISRSMLSTQHTEGEPELREWVADWYSRRGLPTAASQILITAGAQQALAMSTQLLGRRESTIVVEAPTYLGLLDLARMRGLRLLSVPLLGDAQRLTEARKLIVGHTRPVFYVMTTCHTVTGQSMPSEARERLAELVHSTNAYVIDDDILAGQLFEEEAAPPLAAFIDERRVITVGGTSKLLWDGLRVGWIRAPRPLATSLLRMKSAYDLGTSVLSQLVALELLHKSEEIAARRVQESAAKLALTTAFLSERMPEWRWLQPDGGRSLWVKLPDSADADRFAAQAVSNGVAVGSGVTFTSNQSHRDHIRIGFVQPTNALSEGLVRLSDAWAGHIGDHTNSRQVEG